MYQYVMSWSLDNILDDVLKMAFILKYYRDTIGKVDYCSEGITSGFARG